MEIFKVKHQCPFFLYNELKRVKRILTKFVRILLTLFNHFSMKFFQSLYLATWLGL